MNPKIKNSDLTKTQIFNEVVESLAEIRPKVSPNAYRLLLIAAWMVNQRGELKWKNGRTISWTSVAKKAALGKKGLTRPLAELVKLGLAYKLSNGGGGLSLDEVAKCRQKVEAKRVYDGEEGLQAASGPVGELQAPSSAICGLIYNDNTTLTSPHRAGRELSDGEREACREFCAHYFKREFLDVSLVETATKEALDKGWTMEAILEAVVTAAVKWRDQESKGHKPKVPDAHEFIRDEHMKRYLPPERLVELFPESDFCREVEAQTSAKLASKERRGASRVDYSVSLFNRLQCTREIA